MLQRSTACTDCGNYPRVSGYSDNLQFANLGLALVLYDPRSGRKKHTISVQASGAV